MASTFPAMRGRMGDTDYYLMSFKAEELVQMVREPKNMPGWDDERIEEIYQRKINYNRVRNQIAPYLANNKNTRFFGSLIVAALNFDENIHFTSLAEMPAVNEARMPAEHKEAGQKIGMLTLPGGVVMVPLDGQHRLKALEFAIRGKDQRGVDIPGVELDTKLANEDISVILVPYHPEKARRIFTRVNRYARSPTSAETIVTNDEDIFAVLARRVANRIGGRLVKCDKTSLTVNDPHFTTLTVLHTCCKEIIRHRVSPAMFSRADSENSSFTDDETLVFERMVWDDTWKRLLSSDGITTFYDLIQNPKEEGDKTRKNIRKENLLGRPVTQQCLVSAYLMLVGGPTGMHWKEACANLNKIRWAITPENVANIWQNVLWSGNEKGKMITKERSLCTRLIAHMAGVEQGAEQRNDLLKEYLGKFPHDQQNRDLPPRVLD